MSQNKYKYYTVSVDRVVKAKSQTDAVAAAQGDSVDAEIISEDVYVERVSAQDARS